MTGAMEVYVWLVLVACVHPGSEPVGAPVEAEPPKELWVSGYFSDEVARIDPRTGAVVGRFAAPGAQAIVPVPGGARVVAEKSGEILEVTDLGTRVWVSGLSHPTGLARLPDGTWAVGSFSEDRVLRYDDAGALIGELAGGLDGVDAGLSVDARGRLWVPCYDAAAVVVLDEGREVLRFDVGHPRTIRHDADGVAWVSAWTANELARYDAEGAPIDVFTKQLKLTGFAFDDGGVWVGGDQGAAVRRWDLGTREVTAELDPGLRGVSFLAFVP